MDPTAVALAKVNAFARAMKPDLPALEVALGDLRAMLGRAGVSYVLVGGLAVIHHGYVRTTRDIDLLLDRQAAARVVPLLAGAGFEGRSEQRWHHRATGVDVDLLFAGEPMPREHNRYPHLAEMVAAPARLTS